MKRAYMKMFIFFLVALPGLINGQEDAELYTSIPFTVGQHAFVNPFSVYIAASQPGSKEFTLAQFSNGLLTPWAPERVTQNYILDQKNPFYDKKISHLMLLGALPAVVLADFPSDIHYVMSSGSKENPMQVISTGTIQDANEHPTRGIVGLSWSQTQTSAENYTNYVFAAVKPYEGVWGQPGSGIALLKFDQEVVEEKNIQKSEQDKEDKNKKQEKKTVIHQYFNILDAQTGKTKGNKAYPLEICLPPHVSMVHDEQLQNIDLYWDPNFQRLYVPLHIKTDATADSDQGACALLIGTISDGHLSLSPIVCPEVFDSSVDGIIGTSGPNKTVSLEKIRVMHTSTGLPYLIVLGGNGKPDEAATKVAALPLTNRDATAVNAKKLLEDHEHGVIARKHEVPAVRFLSGRYGRFRGRLLQEPSRTKEDFYVFDDRAVKVGAQATLPNAITELIVLKDCVYAVVDKDGNGQQSGIFYSQAIFSQDGKIASWTPWRRASGSCADSIDMIIEPTMCNVSFFDNDPPQIREIQWSHERSDDKKEQTIADVLRKEFPQGSGGVQGLFDFDVESPGVSGQDKTSLLIATGNKKVLLAQTGAENDRGIFVPNTDNKISVLSFCGGVLDELGPLSCAELVHDDNHACIFVGGVDGIVVLSDDNGNGWSTKQGMGKMFSELSPALSWKKFGNYSYVKKIVQDGNVLYILTKDRLERLVISPDATSPATVLATSDMFHAKFTDVLVSGPCALLGTTEGLFRVGSGCDIQKEIGQDAIGWQRITLPVAGSSIISLVSICPSGKDTGFAYDGQVYVLSGSINSNESFVHRFFVKDVQKTGVTDTTICLMADYGVRDHISNFIAFGGYRNNYATNGLFHVSTRGGSSPMIHALPAFVGGKLLIEFKGLPILVPRTNSPSIRPIVKNSADGSWLVAGDFGICTYQ